MLLDGAHLIREALRAGLVLDVVLMTSGFADRATSADARLAEDAARTGARVFIAAPSVMNAASPVRTPSGIVAIASWQPPSIGTAFAPAPALAVGLMAVQDPGNTGAAIRSADALGATGVLALEGTAHPAGWKALRGAMGSTFRLPVCRTGWEAVSTEARRAGASILATVAEDAEPLSAIDFRQPILLLVGNEGAGLPPEIVALSDARVTIPMRPGVDSLNVSVTVAVILYEARRQRALAP
jgi:TrmH family RNA methyltransferase